jgi:hypothetical protein
MPQHTSHRRFKHQENISGRIFEPGDRRTVAAHDPLFVRLQIALIVVFELHPTILLVL